MTIWKIIAKNEIRLKTSRFRTYRRLFFILIFSISLFWGLFFGPLFIDAIIPEIVKQFSHQFETLFVQLIEFTFISIFLMAVMYPLFVLFRKNEIDKNEIILSTPVNPGDILFGELLGQWLFYILFILIIGPFALALLQQINPEMNILHYLIFYLCFFTLYILGSLLGTFIANLIEKKVSIRYKMKEFGKVYLLLISILIIIVYYSFHFIFNFIRIYPEFKNFFIFYPSFWYSNIILYFIDITLIESYILNIWINIILAIFIPILISYILYKKANYFYDIKLGIEKESGIFKQEKNFYRIIRKITHKKFKELVVFQLKAFLRKKENVIKLIFIIGTLGVLGVFIYINFESQIFSLTIEPFSIPITFRIIFDKNVIAIILSWMGGLIFGLFMGMYDFIGPKELFLTYKKSPKGPNTILYSSLYYLFYILIFYNVILTLVFTVIFQLDFLVSLIFFFSYILHGVTILLQALGIQCVRPLFEERRKNLIINNYLIFFFQITSFLIALFIFIPNIPEIINPYLGLIFIILINLGISILIAITLFYFGIFRLSKIE
ncbi:MAG: hypothetical protein ACFFBK_12155 [Promethearchaeota archaeon]